MTSASDSKHGSPSEEAVRMWVLRAGKGGEAHDLFIAEQVIALADENMGSLRSLANTRTAFYQAFAFRNPHKEAVAIRGKGGKFFRFIHEVSVGDYVLYPSLREGRHVYLGIVKSDYFYVPKLGPFSHRRRIRWISSVRKAALSEFAQRELGGARTFFRFKSHVGEIRRLFRRSPHTSAESSP